MLPRRGRGATLAMVQARGNNPLKFSVDDEEVLAALLGMRRRPDMEAPAALSGTVCDMRLHELASLTVTQRR